MQILTVLSSLVCFCVRNPRTLCSHVQEILKSVCPTIMPTFKESFVKAPSCKDLAECVWSVLEWVRGISQRPGCHVTRPTMTAPWKPADMSRGFLFMPAFPSEKIWGGSISHSWSGKRWRIPLGTLHQVWRPPPTHSEGSHFTTRWQNSSGSHVQLLQQRVIIEIVQRPVSSVTKALVAAWRDGWLWWRRSALFAALMNLTSQLIWAPDVLLWTWHTHSRPILSLWKVFFNISVHAGPKEEQLRSWHDLKLLAL